MTLKCEKVVIESFILAWFNNDYEKLSKEDFEIVYAEYIDLSGLYQTKEFELVTYINYLKNRIYVLKTVVYAQETYFEVFKTPYIPGLDFIKEQFGFTYEWTGNDKSFFIFLRKIENAARTKSTELKRKEFEFDNLAAAKMQGDVSKVQSRHEFIRMLNSLSKQGYKIERDKTTIEELALILKQMQEEYAKMESESIKQKR
jgi:hypothetical protein